MERPEFKSTKYPNSKTKLYYVKVGEEYCAIPEIVIKWIEYLETKDQNVDQKTSKIPIDVFSRKECVFNYCPHPELCKDKCIKI